MFHTTPVRVLLLSAVLFLLSGFALAQFGASVQGTVTDKSGAIVSGANVTITDQATGVSHSAVSNASGFYRINDLPPSIYRVEVQATSFKKSTRTDVVVNAEQPTPVNVTLDTGSASETVTVTGAQEALQTEDATIQGTLTSTEVENLPAVNRDPYELVRLAPGVFGDGARAGNGTSYGFPNGPSPGTAQGSSGPGGPTRRSSRSRTSSRSAPMDSASRQTIIWWMASA